MKRILVCLTLLVLIGCKGDKIDFSRIKVDPAFSAYVNAFTSGIMSNSDNIKVVLIQPMQEAKAGEPLTESVFSFEPKIDGQAYWVNQQTIEFRPNQKLNSGQIYEATFHLDELMDVPKDFKKMVFGFMVMHQNITVNYQGIKATDLNDFTNQEIFGTVRTSDVAVPADLESCFKASQNGKDLNIVWTHKNGSKIHEYTITDVIRGKKEKFIDLEWKGEPIGVDINDEKEIRMPPLGEFSVIQATTVREPGLHFSIQFSDPIDPEQDLAGLIYLTSGHDLRLSISQNEVKAYPVGKLDSEETIVINQSIINSKGNQLQSSYKKVVEFNLEKPALELIGDGVIMPSEGELDFPFKAINLKAVNIRIIQIYENNITQFFQQNQHDGTSDIARVGRMVFDGTVDLVSSEAIDYGVWNNFKVDLNRFIDTKPGAIYRVMMSFERYQSLYPCGDSTGIASPMDRQKLNFDSNDYYFDVDSWFEGYASYKDRENPCSDSYYKYYKRQVSRNVMASNFGIIAKEGGNNEYHVAVTHLKTTEPISGVTIEAYNYQNQLIGANSTDGDGTVQFTTPQKPYLLVASKGEQKGYLRVDNSSALSLSLYEVGGSEIKEGLKGYIYGERGVWRPGDSLFMSFILEDKLKSMPETHPIVMEFYDPMGKLYDKKVSTKGVKGIHSFKFKTNEKSPTGSWRLKAIVGNSQFEKSIKIETIKPNRMKIDLDLPNVITAGQSVSTNLSATWLYGAPGSQLKARVEMDVANMKTAFKGYENYQFDDRSNRFSMNEAIVSEGKTGSEGNLKLTFPWKKPTKAPGMLKMKFKTKVFEKGGDFSEDYVSRKYSPYKSYVGVKLPGGGNWRNAINTEKSQGISLVAVDENGKALTRKVKVELYKVSYNWWWEGDGADELTRYINRKSDDLIKSEYYTITNGKGIYDLSFPKRGWGKYMLRVIDPVSGHSAMEEFYADYSGWYSDMDGNSEAASMLNLELDKEEYKVGETAEITVPSGGIGRFYVTVEKGDHVLKQFWVDAKEGSTKFKVPTDNGMAPNVYVSVVLIQPHAQDKNSLPIRMYGVAPLYVSDPQTHLSPVLSCPETVKPETNFKVKVKEKNGKGMAYTLAVVDEGLLSLTRFKTPDAWGTFYTKEALGVRSWDMYKYVMSAQTGKMTALLAVGGDEGLVYKADATANRFKSVVKYIGPFYLEKGKEQSHDIKIPNYIGAVRVMLVAAHEGAYGSAEEEVQVRKPLMVQTTLPRVLGPSEKITIPISVISMSPKIKNVKVKVTTNNLLVTEGSKEQLVSFKKTGDKTVYFNYNVARKLGVAKFKVEVSSGNEKAYEEIEILVRPSNPKIEESQFSMVGSGETWSYDYKSFGISGTNEAKLQISQIPDLNLEKQIGYLIRYPHGCIEQTTSAVFPQLYLSSFVNLTKTEKDKIDANILAALDKYRNFQNSKGGFSYWPNGNGAASEWGTNYAGHFMIEAKNKGYELPSGLLKSWLKFQKGAASQWNRNSYFDWGRYQGDLSQAYRLYTLALAESPAIGAMNRLKNDARLSNAAAWRLAAAYAIIGREKAAAELTNRDYKVAPYRDMGYSYGSDLRDRAMVLETMIYLKDNNRAGELVLDIAKDLNIGWHSTQARAYALLAIGKSIGSDAGSGELKATVTINGKSQNVASELPMYQIELTQKQLKSGKIAVKSSSGRPIFVSFVQAGIPTENKIETKEKDMRMMVSYQDMNGQPVNVKRLKQGQDFKAIVSITHPGIRKKYQEVALNQIFPSGWQIINSRINDDFQSNGQLDYQDFRDDRVYSYFSLNSRQTITIEVNLNATFLGRFYQPAVFCAPMYDESISSIKAGGWVEVVKE
ncbi:MAG: alpha-2-macroglobulin [Crocinitomicaceae bacterium]